MVIPFQPLQARMVRIDAVRRHSYVENVRTAQKAWLAGRLSLARLCAGAGDALHEYASETLSALLTSSGRYGRRTAPWVLEAYVKAIGHTAVAMRDTITDSEARHAVAHTLQTRLLREESRSLDPRRTNPLAARHR